MLEVLGGWKELYVTFSYSAYMKKKSVLEKNLSVKTKIRSSRNRLSRDVVMGANPLSTNSSQISNTTADEYVIFVKKENYETAKKLINL